MVQQHDFQLLTHPKFAKPTAFTQSVLTEKNPDWQLLHVKSVMEQDEDKPLYSCFSPDGYFREMMLPQTRSAHTNRQIPKELRGLVRVMQLPIISNQAQLLSTRDNTQIGDVKIIARPDIF